MAADATWQFVDGDMPGDGAMWLEHPTQLAGCIDFRESPNAAPRRIIAVTRSFVEASLVQIGREAKCTVFAAMLVVPDGSPTGMRAAIDAAVQGGGVSLFASPINAAE